MFCTLGKIFSRCHFEVKFSADAILKYFSYFSQIIGFDISCKLGNNFHKMSDPVFYEK